MFVREPEWRLGELKRGGGSVASGWDGWGRVNGDLAWKR